jgi:hypothetical protein
MSTISITGSARQCLAVATDPWAGVLEHLENASSVERDAGDRTGSRLGQFVNETIGSDYRRPVPQGTDGATERTERQTPLKFTVVERCDARDIIVSWQDPTRGRLGEQRWRLGTAYVSGVCAISGRQISRGDYVFRPLRPAVKFPQLGDMILATAIDSILEEMLE